MKGIITALILACFIVSPVDAKPKCKRVRQCWKGKPCGNGCIAKDRKCHRKPGCARKGKGKRPPNNWKRYKRKK